MLEAIFTIIGLAIMLIQLYARLDPGEKEMRDYLKAVEAEQQKRSQAISRQGRH